MSTPSPRARAGSAGSGQVPAPSPGPRSGAHRPRRPVWHEIVPIAVVVVLVAVLAFAAHEVWGTFDTGTKSSQSGPLPPDDDNGPTATGTASATASHSPSTSPTSSSTGAAGTVDKSLTIAVYNATERSGLAASATTALQHAGWTAKVGGNEKRFTPPGTTVYYGSASLKATAQAVEHSLDGSYRIHQSTEYGSTAVTVVLGSDYSD